jgi:hypothetical protein
MYYVQMVLFHSKIWTEKGYVRIRDFDKATGSHFNQREHCLSDTQVAVVEKREYF